MNDTLVRPLRNLRLSVTDRCNLRCEYCMPEDDYAWLPREDVLHFEEISALVDVFLSLGVDRVRLTGGEPLLRRDISTLLHMLSAKKGIRDLALTTNGVLLSDQVDQLKAAGLGRITVSLDTLRPDRFRLLTRFDQLDAVHAGIAAATRTFGTLKIDSVVMRGVNEDELAALIEYGKSARAEVRFIEYMDVGGATRWSADRFTLGDGTTFGIISSTTEPFCRSCDRSRLTADGMWYLCLYATQGLDLRGPLRRGASSDDLRTLIANRWRSRDDRGAEQRLALGGQRAFVPVQDLLKRDPHLEMHTRG